MKSIGLLVIIAVILFFLLSCGRSLMSDKTPQIIPLAEQYRVLSPEERIEEDTNRRGIHYGNRMRVFLAEREEVKPGGTVFLGDSITEGFPLNKAFDGDNLYNRGIGGDRVQGLRERLDVCVLELQPENIFIMIGTNDAVNPSHENIDAWASDYQELIREIQYYAPRTKITLFTVLPVSQNFVRVLNDIPEYNRNVKRIAKEYGLGFVDLDPIMKDEKGQLKAPFTSDGVHLTLEGYVAWLVVFLGPEESFKPVWNLARDWKYRYDKIHTLSAVNPSGVSPYPGGRGPDELILFTPEYGKNTTGTNQWGKEVIVREGKVTAQAANDTPIPEDGFILSGHGVAAQWLTYNLQPGIAVTIDGMQVITGEIDTSGLTDEDKLRYLQNKLICLMAEVQEQEDSKYNTDELRRIWEKIARLQIDPSKITDKVLDQLKQDIENL